MRYEYGRVGQYRYAGMFFEEFLPELRGTRGVQTYYQMSENDDTVGAILFAIQMLIRQVDFTIEPGGPSETDKAAAEFVDSCLYDMEADRLPPLTEEQLRERLRNPLGAPPIRELARRYSVRRVVLFGSRARGDYRRTSDIDLAVTGGDIDRFALDVDEETSTLLEYDIVNLDRAMQDELREAGLVKKRGPKDKKSKTVSLPFHYVSSDGFHIYVGKNNYQNEEVTFKIADGGDWWFHAKGMPGSHVIVKTGGSELPDRTFEEAGRLAAYYSSGRSAKKVEIDYIQRKHVKKVAGGAPGFVIYHTNYSLIAEPDIQGIKEASPERS